MKSVKKAIAFFLFSALILSLSVTAFSKEKVGIYGSSVKGKGTETVSVDINLKNAEGITSGNFIIDFDSRDAEFVSAEIGNSLFKTMYALNTKLNGQVRLAFISVDGLKDDGTILKINFRIKATEEKEIPIKINVVELSSEDNALEYSVNNGKIKVQKSVFEKNDLNGDGKVDGEDVLLFETALLNNETEKLPDLNGDKKIDISDYIYMKYLYGKN